MKKILKGILFYMALLASSIILDSCCEECNKILGSGTVEMFQTGGSSRDTVIGPFGLSWFLDHEVKSCYNQLFIPSAYAFSCEQTLVNPIQLESLKLFCNKDIVFKGVNIPAGTNLIGQVFLKLNIDDRFGGARFLFLEEEFSSLTFNHSWHNFDLFVETSDGIKLQNDITLFMDIK